MDLETSATALALPGWRILSPPYLLPSPIDGLSLEWDYFMIHDRYGQFTGILGYFLGDPRDRFKNLVFPSGGSIAVSGELSPSERFAEFESFGCSQTELSAEKRLFLAKDAATGTFATLRTDSQLAPNACVLQGRSTHLEWDLVIQPDWGDRQTLFAQPDAPFSPTYAKDFGLFPGEHWTVHMVAPRTTVNGTLTYRPTGRQINIEGHGYRENAWGRWSLALDGWDFVVISDAATGVQWALQTYHRSKALDFLDVAFIENGQLRGERFRADRRELGWQHAEWVFDADARQYVPLNTTVVAANSRYRIEATVSIGQRQAPMLSKITPMTRLFFIMEQFPWVEGQITRRDTNEVVACFAGQAGGEFAYFRTALARLPHLRWPQWSQQFASPFPHL